MSTFLHGVGTVQFLDKSAEVVDLRGLDITSLEKTGVINYEHLSTLPSQLVGKILKAKKIFSKDDCLNEHELYFWNKVKVPYLYIMAELLDDYCDSAKHVAGVLRYDRDRKDQNEYAIMWFSVEGSEIPNSRTNKQIVSRGIARKVTLTSAPCNQGCAAEILDNQKPQVKDDFDDLFRSEQEAITLFKSGEGAKLYETYLAKKEAEGPSQGGRSPKSPSQEYGGQRTHVGTNQSGKQVYSHGTVRPYGFNPSEHQHSGEHHNHAIVTAQNPKLGINKPARTAIHSNATVSGGIVENRAALSLNDKSKIAAQQGKQQVAKNEKFCELHKAEPSGWSKGKVDKGAGAVHYEHPEHGLVTIQKQPSGEFHVKHHGALAGVGGVKGVFSTAKEAGTHARKYMQGVSQGTVLPNRAHNHPSPSMLGKNELKKALEAGSYNAAPSTLTNGAAYQRENLSSSQAKTGAEENTFHGTKKKDWNKQAKDDYDHWPHKERFEKFMKARMPHLADGEIRAIGRALSLKKNFDLEKSLKSLISLKKSPENDKIDLIHYSSHPNLTEVNPKFHGKGVDSRTKGRETWHPHSFYYRAGTKPEELVTGRSPHRYHAQIDPKTQPIYDIGSDPEGHVANSPNMDAVHEKLKEKGYHGFHNSKHPDLSHVVAMYHPLKVEAEKSIAKAEPPNKPEIKINPEHGKTIANAYDKMQHSPNHPEVKSAYNALIGETGNQFKNILGSGLKISKIKPGQASPYKNSKDMHHDIKQNKHLWYFPTDQGFGTEGEQPKDHPMLAQTKFTHEGKPLLANDIFRIVHDINGHHAGGETGFGPKGEHQAYLQHKKMYSPLANKALFTETAGQNNWVNYGPHGEANRANPAQTKFAEQKAGLMPDNIINGKWHNEA